MSLLVLAGTVLVSLAEEPHWAFTRLAPPTVPAVDEAWCRDDLDRFIRQAQIERGVIPNKTADPRTLIRRVTYDLTGLPPTPEEVTAFLEDDQSGAYERVVDRLLASPRYGERWGLHWLDVARYGDTLGYRYDDPIPSAWRYRDFVIQSLNRDQPFDEFVRWQIAGDEIAPDNRDAIAATGFCAVGPRPRIEGNELNRKEARYIEINDIVSTTFSAFLGLSMDCARCHDHKHDPISQREYYSVAKAFLSGERKERPYLTGKEQVRWRAWQEEFDGVAEEIREWKEGNAKGVAAVESEIREPLQQAKGELEELFFAELEKTHPGLGKKAPLGVLMSQHGRGQLGAEGYSRWRELQVELAEVADTVMRRGDLLRQRLPGERFAKWLAITRKRDEVISRRPLGPQKCVAYVEDQREASPSLIFKRGVVGDPGEEVPLAFPSVLSSAPMARWAVEGERKTTYQRSALANWLTDVDHGAGGLLARVMVNRVWYHHFGEGLVGTPNDFGTQGQRPELPDLLNYLAGELIRNDWHLKSLHRRVVLSATYRISVDSNEAGVEGDPNNVTWWRRRSRNAEAEVLRDSVLAVSGRMNERMGGDANYLPIPKEEVLTFSDKPYPTEIKDGPSIWRRSIYAARVRTLPVPMLRVFDAPDGNDSCGRRVTTTVAPQALVWLNDEFVRWRSRDFSMRIWRESEDRDEARVQRAFALALGRPATAGEERSAVEFVAAQTKRREGDLEGAWEDFCQGLFGLNEFSYID